MPVTKAKETSKEIFLNALVNAGYKPKQAEQMLTSLQDMRSGKGVFGHKQLNAICKLDLRCEDDFWKIMDGWNKVAAKKSLSQLSEDEIKKITKGVAGPVFAFREGVKAGYQDPELYRTRRSFEMGAKDYRGIWPPEPMEISKPLPLKPLLPLPGGHSLALKALKIFNEMARQLTPSRPSPTKRMPGKYRVPKRRKK